MSAREIRRFLVADAFALRGNNKLYFPTGCGGAHRISKNKRARSYGPRTANHRGRRTGFHPRIERRRASRFIATLQVDVELTIVKRDRARACLSACMPVWARGCTRVALHFLAAFGAFGQLDAYQPVGEQPERISTIAPTCNPSNRG